jgi:hypothetical protein
LLDDRLMDAVVSDVPTSRDTTRIGRYGGVIERHGVIGASENQRSSKEQSDETSNNAHGGFAAGGVAGGAVAPPGGASVIVLPEISCPAAMPPAPEVMLAGG